MIVDGSAVVAILREEPGYERVEACLAVAEKAGIGAPTLVESSMVLCARLGPSGKTLLARFVTEADIDAIDFTAEHWSVAADAFLRYGNGRHPASLNFGDCLTTRSASSPANRCSASATISPAPTWSW